MKFLSKKLVLATVLAMSCVGGAFAAKTAVKVEGKAGADALFAKHRACFVAGNPFYEGKRKILVNGYAKMVDDVKGKIEGFFSTTIFYNCIRPSKEVANLTSEVKIACLMYLLEENVFANLKNIFAKESFIDDNNRIRDFIINKGIKGSSVCAALVNLTEDQELKNTIRAWAAFHAAEFDAVFAMKAAAKEAKAKEKEAKAVLEANKAKEKEAKEKEEKAVLEAKNAKELEAKAQEAVGKAKAAATAVANQGFIAKWMPGAAARAEKAVKELAQKEAEAAEAKAAAEEKAKLAEAAKEVAAKAAEKVAAPASVAKAPVKEKAKEVAAPAPATTAPVKEKAKEVAVPAPATTAPVKEKAKEVAAKAVEKVAAPAPATTAPVKEKTKEVAAPKAVEKVAAKAAEKVAAPAPATTAPVKEKAKEVAAPAPAVEDEEEAVEDEEEEAEDTEAGWFDTAKGLVSGVADEEARKKELDENLLEALNAWIADPADLTPDMVKELYRIAGDMKSKSKAVGEHLLALERIADIRGDDKAKRLTELAKVIADLKK